MEVEVGIEFDLDRDCSEVFDPTLETGETSLSKSCLD